MGAQEPLVEETNMKQEEEEETLSLCDLPLYSDQSADWDDEYFSISNSKSNSISTTTTTSSHQDFFEFFSQELSPSSAAAASFPPENIIFCGKLIPYKQLSPPCKTDHNNKNNIISPEKIKTKTQTSRKKSSRWRWRLSSGKKVSIPPQNGAKCTIGAMHPPQRISTYNSSKHLGSYNKAKWYLYLFGVSRSFSPVVELSEIRSRQSRRRSAPPPAPAMFGDYDDGKVGDRRWGLMWGLIRALSCGGGNQPAALAAVAPPPE